MAYQQLVPYTHLPMCLSVSLCPFNQYYREYNNLSCSAAATTCMDPVTHTTPSSPSTASPTSAAAFATAAAREACKRKCHLECEVLKSCRISPNQRHFLSSRIRQS